MKRYAIALVSLASLVACGSDGTPIVLIHSEDATWDSVDLEDLATNPDWDGLPDLAADADNDAELATAPDTAIEVEIGDLSDTLPDQETWSDADSQADEDSHADLEVEADAEDTIIEPVIPPVPVRVLAWLGGGVQVVLELPPEAGGPDEWPDVWLDSEFDEPVDAVVSGANLTTGLTAIMVVPSDDELEHSLRLELAAAVLDELPEGEQVAVLVARDTPELLAELSSDRMHAHAQLASLAPEAGWAAAPVITELRLMMADVESRFTTQGRSVIVIGETAQETPPHIKRPVQTLSLADIADPVADAETLVAELLGRRAAIVRVGACTEFADDQPFDLHWGDAVVSLNAPEPMEHMAAEVCDPVDAAQDDYPYPTEIQLTFTPAELLVFNQYYAENNKADFTTSVTLGVGLPITAVAHIHGQSTLSCVRKSITVELDGPRRRLMPEFASDRFILISMCQDERYFGQVFGNRLLAGLGLFPSRFKHVRLRIDGVNKGIYMLVHQAERAFRDRSLAVVNIMRRLYDIDGQPTEVKYVSDPASIEEAVAYFESIGELGYSGPVETLEADLDERLQLDQYLRYVGAMSLLMNGDYIDEVFFASAIEDGVERYRVGGWDTDDLLNNCHFGGNKAIDDECGVTYCTEAKVDYALLRSAAVYQRYLDALQYVMAAFTPELLQWTMDEVQEDLFAVLSDDETAAACIEMVAENPLAATAAGAQEDIAIHMDSFLEQIEARRQVLTDALAVCPALMP